MHWINSLNCINPSRIKNAKLVSNWLLNSKIVLIWFVVINNDLNCNNLIKFGHVYVRL